MGLDNIPMKYPCETQGTAVKVLRHRQMSGDSNETFELIDCDATMEVWGCPWQEALSKANLPDSAKPTYGMLGCPCWYRGKWGNKVIEVIGLKYNEPDTSFYGDNESGTEKSPRSCLALANEIDEAVYAIEAGIYYGEDGGECTAEEVLGDAKYASWWLKWVANEAEGAACWY